ncbi:hypothetical protein B0T26DRAFT_403728 [Lasiosphaeria miniovina]|uniref:Uncharacterized protein n=1 Tax=Lasiosphaeria miniovina TaxID=1954250 RepID=A0AA40A507_9PEZI|nr:uncharacterized protein B0T26DRAFT_403728 [Lasiosphaeria miniovina]KAK0709377.1 hypothetical protein B0T26DRAFT_403728 [Lasiosphaeria miniovina]
MPRHYDAASRCTLQMPRFHRARVQALGADIAGTHAGDDGSTRSAATTWLDSAWTRPWQSRAFARLVHARLALEVITDGLRTNMDALGLLGGAFRGPDRRAVVEGWEADAWHSRRETLGSSGRRLDILWQAYSEAVAARESIASNRQGRQGRHVGYLSSLATLSVPVSLGATILSMGGDFAAGASRFWVYWAVAVPSRCWGLWCCLRVPVGGPWGA